MISRSAPELFSCYLGTSSSPAAAESAPFIFLQLTCHNKDDESADAMEPVEDGPGLGLRVGAAQTHHRLYNGEHRQQQTNHRVERRVLKTKNSMVYSGFCIIYISLIKLVKDSKLWTFERLKR